MTVCIAALFQWNYGTLDAPQLGFGAVTMSDRKVTVGDMEYEPNQTKVASFGNCLVLVAGDLAIHSQAIQDTDKELKSRHLPSRDIAIIYGRAIQAVNARHAESEILAPLGLNTDAFQAKQKDFSQGFVDTITSQLQNRQPSDVEALVVGSNGERAQIFLVDSRGREYCMDDAGFAAIGIGAWHAKSRLMSVGHVSSRILAPTLAALFAAKRSAELAPGVGSATDINIILKDAHFPLWSSVRTEIERLFASYNRQAVSLGDQMTAELQSFLDEPANSPVATDNVERLGADAQAKDNSIADAGESPGRA